MSANPAGHQDGRPVISPHPNPISAGRIAPTTAITILSA